MTGSGLFMPPIYGGHHGFCKTQMADLDDWGVPILGKLQINSRVM